MKNTFEFSNIWTPQCLIDVEDIGKCSLEGKDKDGMFYYFCIYTILGKSHILTFGPIDSDFKTLNEFFSLTYKKTDYEEIKITKEIQMFLNKNKLTDAKEINYDTFIENVPDIVSYYNYAKRK